MQFEQLLSVLKIIQSYIAYRKQLKFQPDCHFGSFVLHASFSSSKLFFIKLAINAAFPLAFNLFPNFFFFLMDLIHSKN